MEKQHSADQEINFVTSSAGYPQILGRPRHVINNSMTCIDLIFLTNEKVVSKYGVDASIFDKYYYNIICGKIDICVPLPPNLSMKFGITVKQMLETLKNLLKF